MLSWNPSTILHYTRRWPFVNTFSYFLKNTRFLIKHDLAYKKTHAEIDLSIDIWEEGSSYCFSINHNSLLSTDVKSFGDSFQTWVLNFFNNGMIHFLF